VSLTTSFHRLLKGFFGEEGLVAMNPRSPAILSLTTPFWERVWDRPARLQSAISIASRTLSDLHLPLQVPLREGVLPIFYIDEEGIRHRISLRDEEVHLGRTGKKISIAEAGKWAQESPEKFSPAVLLRPLLQDFLLPTLAYVAGPSEIAYQCQSGSLYDLLEIPHPVIFPRLSATLVEPFVQRILGKYQWTVKDALGGQEILLYQKGPSLQSFDELFQSGAAHLQAWLERIAHDLQETYPPVDASLELDRARRKLSYQWWKLHNIVKRKLSERDEVRVRHSQLVSRHLLPQGKLQERFYSPLYYLAQYGISDLGKELMREYNPWKPYHLIIYLQ
ncbi:MAG: bacillithiol biosynthesis BshC, partial [bacterium]